MSKWTDVRDNIVDVLNVDVVTDELKDQVTNTLLEQVMPIIENAVDGGFAMLESCGKGGFAADEVLRGWSEGDGAVGGLGLRQKGLAAL